MNKKSGNLINLKPTELTEGFARWGFYADRTPWLARRIQATFRSLVKPVSYEGNECRSGTLINNRLLSAICKEDVTVALCHVSRVKGY